jgi:hypothetical protein
MTFAQPSYSRAAIRRACFPAADCGSLYHGWRRAARVCAGRIAASLRYIDGANTVLNKGTKLRWQFSLIKSSS